MKKLYVFDLDGTLVDSVIDIASAVNRALEIMGKPTFATREYYKMVGNGMEMLCRRALPDGTEAEIAHLISLYKDLYIANCCQKTVPYDGIPELLAWLKKNGAILAVLSNKPQKQADKVVSALFGNKMFDWIIGHRAEFAPKPDTGSLEYLIKKSGVDKSDICYIGDSDVDIQLGKRGDVCTIGVAWGFRGRKELEEAGAANIAENIAELKKIIDETASFPS